jgi:hypothetical protein
MGTSVALSVAGAAILDLTRSDETSRYLRHGTSVTADEHRLWADHDGEPAWMLLNVLPRPRELTRQRSDNQRRVRRPLRPFSLTVHAYLAHLRDVGFTGVPLPLGVDEQGREVLSFVPGEVPRWPLPPELAGEHVLVALARLIHALREASAG